MVVLVQAGERAEVDHTTNITFARLAA